MSSEEKAYRSGFQDRDHGVLEPIPSRKYDAPSPEYSAYVQGYIDRGQENPHLYDDNVQYQGTLFV